MSEERKPEAMEVEMSEQPAAVSFAGEDEEDISALTELMDDASAKPASERIAVLEQVLADTAHLGHKATILKERAMYDMTRTLCELKKYSSIVPLLQETTFLSQITKSKTAKVVRAVLDITYSLAPTELDMQAEICSSIIEWTRKEKRTFLRQRVEAKLASILVEQKDFGAALALVDRLLMELKKLDDKQLLVETHLQEAKIHFGLRNVPKAKAALTASRTAANAIYVSPQLQATIDSMSGIIHCEEGDYDTAHSYFLEAFEQLDQLNDNEKAVQTLKYMMLCRILDSLTKALKLSAKGGVGEYIIYNPCRQLSLIIAYFHRMHQQGRRATDQMLIFLA
jgi:26S proteasome regulatory subunit N6